MASYIDDLKTARNNLAEELRRETAARVAIVAAGGAPRVTFSMSGRSYDFTGWLNAMTAQIKAIDEMIATLDEPFELPMQGF